MNPVKLAALLIVLSGVNAVPALADNFHDNRSRYQAQTHSRYQTPVRAHHNYGYNKHRMKKVSNWNQQRSLYRNNWRKINATQQRALDAQMRAQWRAYHHNRWNGNYSWSNYSDPAFLDYLHTSNPSLLTQIGSFLGF
jgi:hypothetical protein